MAAANTGVMQVWRGREDVRRNAVILDAALASAGAEVSARWPAIDVWLAHHPEAEPLAVVVQDDTRYTAAAVVSISIRHGLAVVTSATEPGTFAALTALTADAATRLADGLVTQISQAYRRWTIRLGMLADCDPAAGALLERIRHGRIESGDGAPRLLFQPGSDVRRYLSRNTRSAVARSANRLRNAGHQFQLTWLTTASDAEAILPDVLDVHRRRNRQLRGHALLDDPAQAQYFADMVSRYAAAGQLDLLTAEVDGDLAAFAVCFTGGSTRWVYANLAPEWTRFGVGTMANAEVVRRSHAQPGIRCLDWGGGRQRYKLSAGAHIVDLCQLEGCSSVVIAAVVRAARLDVFRRLRQVAGLA